MNRQLPMLLLLFLAALAQTGFAATDTTFFDADWKPMPRAGAMYFRPAPSVQNGLYQIRDYYISGALQSEGYFSNLDRETREGYWTYFSAEGLLTGKEHYRNGLAVDTSLYFHKDRVIKRCVSPAAPGMQYCRIYDSTDGRLRRDETLVNGVRSGITRLYTPGGRLLRNLMLEKETRNGCSQEFDTLTGAVTTEACFLQNEVVSVRFLSTTGRPRNEVSMSNGRRNGMARTWDTLTGNLLSTRTFQNDSMTGPAQNFFSECPFVRESYHLRNGARNGEFRRYYQCSDRLLSMVNYSDGKPEGVYTAYDPETRARVVEGHDRKGEEDGEWTYFFPDGKTRRMIKTYVNGELEGPLRTWWPSGKLRREERYANGVLQDRKCYARDGSDTAMYPLFIRAAFLKTPQYYFDRWMPHTSGVSGKARIKVYIYADKTISDVEVISSDAPALNTELQRVARTLPVSQPSTEDDMRYYCDETFTINLQPQVEESEND